MARSVKSQGKTRFVPAALAAAGLALTIPAAGLAVVQGDTDAPLPDAVSYLPFTPAKVDPQLAARVAAVMGEDGLRFTPASKPGLASDRTVTVAVRVDDATARAISVRSAINSVGTGEDRERVLAVSPTSYNLGVARGYQSFALGRALAALIISRLGSKRALLLQLAVLCLSCSGFCASAGRPKLQASARRPQRSISSFTTPTPATRVTWPSASSGGWPSC